MQPIYINFCCYLFVWKAKTAKKSTPKSAKKEDKGGSVKKKVKKEAKGVKEEKKVQWSSKMFIFTLLCYFTRHMQFVKVIYLPVLTESNV